MFSRPPCSWWLISEPFINTTSQNPPPCFLRPAAAFPHCCLISVFLYLPIRWVKLSLQVKKKKRPSSLPHDSPPVPCTPFGFETTPGENQVTQATHSGRVEEGMWSHLIVERLYSDQWQSALWLCSVRWALRLKPYTGKASRWPWLVKCSHFHQEEVSVQRLFWAGKLPLERQLLWALRSPVLPYFYCWKHYKGISQKGLACEPVGRCTLSIPNWEIFVSWQQINQVVNILINMKRGRYRK